MAKNEEKTPRLGLDWDLINELRERFWQAQREKEAILRRLEKLREERRKLERKL